MCRLTPFFRSVYPPYQTCEKTRKPAFYERQLRKFVLLEAGIDGLADTIQLSAT